MLQNHWAVGPHTNYQAINIHSKLQKNGVSGVLGGGRIAQGAANRQHWHCRNARNKHRDTSGTVAKGFRPLTA